jgi:Copper chaperone
MKTLHYLLLLILCMGVAAPSLQAQGKKKDKETVTFFVSMSCEKCKAKIEKNIPHEKGVTDLKVNLAEKKVTIEYNPTKTTPEALKEALEKLGYKVFFVDDEKKKE